MSIVDFVEFYLLQLLQGGHDQMPTRRPSVGRRLVAGRAVFTQLGCATCHIPTLTINRDRRVADVETMFSDFTRHADDVGNPFNRLFATASLRHGRDRRRLRGCRR